MKKLFALAIILIFVPFTAFGLQTLNEDVLDNVTGQAGVSIDLDVSMYVDITTVAWGDSDGIGGTSTAGYVGLETVDIDALHVVPRLDWALDPATIAQLQFLTIDVATEATLYGGRTFVRINPGTLQLDIASLSADVALGSDITLAEAAGETGLTNLQVLLNQNNFIDIYTHGANGVSINLGLNIDAITMDTNYWGDTDGLGAAEVPANPITGTDYLAYYSNGDFTDAGYAGISDLEVDNLTISGTIDIDVATLDYGVIAGDSAGILGLYAILHGAGVVFSDSFVHLNLDAITIGADQITGTVELGSTTALGDTNGTLGNFYIAGVSATVDGWVDIFAH